MHPKGGTQTFKKVTLFFQKVWHWCHTSAWHKVKRDIKLTYFITFQEFKKVT